MDPSDPLALTQPVVENVLAQYGDGPELHSAAVLALYCLYCAQRGSPTVKIYLSAEHQHALMGEYMCKVAACSVVALPLPCAASGGSSSTKACSVVAAGINITGADMHLMLRLLLQLR